VAQCANPVEAGFLRDQLGRAGIRAFVRDSILGTTDPLLTPALGGIRVDVEEEKADLAREILREIAAARPPNAGASPWIEDDDLCPACRVSLPDESDACPGCGWSCGAPDSEAGPAPG
jgi:hypothetical protein